MEREVPEENGGVADRGDTDAPSEEEFFQRLRSFPNLFFQRCVEKANKGRLTSTLRVLMDKQERRQQGEAPDLDDEEDPKNLTIFLQWLLASDEPPEEEEGKKRSSDRAVAETKAKRAEAETKAERAARENPRSLLALSNQAYILWHNGQTRPALQLLQALEGLRQEAFFQDLVTEAQSEVVYLYIRLGHLFTLYAVSELLEQLLARKPLDGTIKFTLGQTLRRYTNASHIRKYSSIEDLIPAVRKAIRLFVEITENRNNSLDLRARAWAELGEMLHWQEEEKLRLVVEQERGRLRLSAGQCFEKAAELAKHNPAALVCAGKYFRMEKDLQRSRELLEKAIQIRPEPKAHHQLGLTFRQLAIHRGSGSRPGGCSTFANGMIHVLSIDDPFVQETMHHFEESLRLNDGDNFAALFALGEMCFSLQKYEEALDHFQNTCEQAPDLSYICNKIVHHIGFLLAEMAKEEEQREYCQEMSQFCFHFFLIGQCWLLLQSQGGTPVNREAWISLYSLWSALQVNRPEALTRVEGVLMRNLKVFSSRLPVLKDISRYNKQSAINSKSLETTVQDYLSRGCFHGALLLLCLLKLTSQSGLMNTWRDADILRKTLVRTAKDRLHKSAENIDSVSNINKMAARILFRIALEISFSSVAVPASSGHFQTSPSQGRSSQEGSLSSAADRLARCPAGRQSQSTKGTGEPFPEFPQPEPDDSAKETLHVLLVHEMEASGDVRTILSLLRDVCGLRTSLLKKGKGREGGHTTPLAHKMQKAQLTVFVVENSDISSEFEEQIKKATTTASASAAMMSSGACSPANPFDQSASPVSSTPGVVLLLMNSATLPSDLCQGHRSFTLTSAQLGEGQGGSSSEAGVRGARACCHLFCGLLGIQIDDGDGGDYAAAVAAAPPPPGGGRGGGGGGGGGRGGGGW